MSPQQIEAFGKVGGAIVAIAVLGWVLNSVVTQNSELTSALQQQVALAQKQTELAQQQTELAKRQTEALEKLVLVYSGGAK
jgi:hypothetical protein